MSAGATEEHSKETSHPGGMRYRSAREVVLAPGEPDITGCRELAREGEIKAAECCRVCHSADEYTLAGSRGPCRMTLADGRVAAVCCAARKRLLQAGALPAGQALTTTEM